MSGTGRVGARITDAGACAMQRRAAMAAAAAAGAAKVIAVCVASNLLGLQLST